MKTEQAFPNPHRTDMTGMTLRDYFAAKALQGICASGPDPSWTNARLAAEAYDLADAMLQVRGQA